MATIDQIKRGLATFVDKEMLAKMQIGSFQRVMIGTGIGLALSNLDKTLRFDNPIISMLGVVNEDGTINIDSVASELKKNIPDEGMRFDLDILGIKLGSIVFHKNDVEILRTNITSA
jgi:hypothetical protein